MKKIFILVLFFIALFIGRSGSKSSEDIPQENIIDFGKGTYRPNPFKFLDNVPPFSWMGMPDTVVGKTSIEISFNEDAIRSKAEGIIYLIDENGHRVEGIGLGDSNTDKFPIKAQEKEITIPVYYKVDPLKNKEGILKGSVVFEGKNLDMINETPIISDITPVSSWILDYREGINWWRWIILILLILIGCILLYYLIRIVLVAINLIYKLLKKLPRKEGGDDDDDDDDDDDKYPKVYRKQAAIDFLRKKGERSLIKSINEIQQNRGTLFNTPEVTEFKDGSKEVKFVGSPIASVSKIFITKNKKIYAQGGSLSGEIGAQNEFLNFPVPNRKYIIDKYTVIKTDSLSRPKKVWVEDWRSLKNQNIIRGGRHSHIMKEVTKGFPNHDAGHLVNMSAGGSNEKINLVPMDSNFNKHGEWSAWENKIRSLLKDKENKSISSIINVKYPSKTTRPSKFIITDIINGRKSKIKLKNG